jgi:transcription termination factor Rho
MADKTTSSEWTARPRRTTQPTGNTGNGSNQARNAYPAQPRRQRRTSYTNNNREQVVPQTNREDLAALKVAQLREKAVELEIDLTEIKKKDQLIDAVLAAMVKAEGFIICEGIFDLLPEGYGFLRTSGYLPGENDVYVGMSLVRRNSLRKGDMVVGQVRPARDNEKYAALHRIDSVNDLPVDISSDRRRFADLTPVYPDKRLLMEHGTNTITARTIDLVAPIGMGQRGLIVSPPKAGKTTILKDIAAAISANNPNVHLMCLLVDERPEEVTDMERSIKGEVVSSTFDMPSENHITVAELVIERAKRLVEVGRDVVILLDSITRLARAYNLAQPASGRILSGGVDSTALYPPKRFLGAARNIEDGGSLTILASALIDTGSKMDEVIFEEFKGTGNMELRLDRDLADRRIFPAIDPVASGTRKEELLLDSQEAPLIWAVRRILANMNNTERAMEMLIKSLKQTQTNAEFLMRTAKKAQQRTGSDITEL